MAKSTGTVDLKHLQAAYNSLQEETNRKRLEAAEWKKRANNLADQWKQSREALRENIRSNITAFPWLASEMADILT